MKNMIPDLRGLAILDNDGRNREDTDEGGLKIVYWQRYEAENYFITPDVLLQFVAEQYSDMELFGGFRLDAEEVLSDLILERLFSGDRHDYQTWKESTRDASRLVWDAKTERLKLSDFAEEFFRRLANRLGHAMLLKKGELHRLVAYAESAKIPHEVCEKLDYLKEVLEVAKQHDEAKASR